MNDIEVIIVNPPIWLLHIKAISNTESFLVFENTLDKISKRFGIDIYNPSHDILNSVLEKKDFLNTQHLNYYGSQKFTQYFCDHLLKITTERKERTHHTVYE